MLCFFYGCVIVFIGCWQYQKIGPEPMYSKGKFHLNRNYFTCKIIFEDKNQSVLVGNSWPNASGCSTPTRPAALSHLVPPPLFFASPSPRRSALQRHFPLSHQKGLREPSCVTHNRLGFNLEARRSLPRLSPPSHFHSNQPAGLHLFRALARPPGSC